MVQTVIQSQTLTRDTEPITKNRTYTIGIDPRTARHQQTGIAARLEIPCLAIRHRRETQQDAI
jgi:hypothetical protein